MATNIDTISIVANGARDATDLVAGLQHNGVHIRAAEKLQGGREAGGAGADENGSFRHEDSRCLRSRTTEL